MKKIAVTIFLLGSLFLGTSAFASNINFLSNKTIYPVDTYNPPGCSKEELYQDIFMTMLHPYVQKAVIKYYGQFYAVDPVAKVLSIDRPNGYRTFYFVIKLEVIPYKGAHNSVGVDHITLLVDSMSTRVLKFEHIETIKPD